MTRSPSPSIVPTALCRVLAVFAVAATGAAELPAETPVELGQTTTLDAYLDAVCRTNPRLAVARAVIDVTHGHRTQAGLRPNPELELEVEEMATNRVGILSEAVNRVVLSTEIVSSGKRSAALAVADAEIEAAGHEYALIERQTMAAAKRAFFTQLAAQERIVTFERLLEIVGRSVQASRARVTAGDVPRVDAVRAEVALSRALLAHRAAERDLENARAAVQQQLAPDSPSIDTVGPATLLYEHSSIVVDRESLWASLETHPALRRLQAQLSRADSESVLAHRERWPNVQLGVGLEVAPGASGGHDGSLIIGLSLPLPILDRNQGAIAAAAAACRQAQFARDAGRSDLTAQLRHALSEYHAAGETVVGYRENIIPGARGTFDLVQRAYVEGAIGQLELLEAQQALVEAELDHIAALMELRIAESELESFAAMPCLGTESR